MSVNNVGASAPLTGTAVSMPADKTKPADTKTAEKQPEMVKPEDVAVDMEKAAGTLEQIQSFDFQMQKKIEGELTGAEPSDEEEAAAGAEGGDAPDTE